MNALILLMLRFLDVDLLLVVAVLALLLLAHFGWFYRPGRPTAADRKRRDKDDP